MPVKKSIQSNQTPPANNSNFKKIMGILLLILIGLPIAGIGLMALGIGGLSVGCDQKTKSLESHAAIISGKLDSMAMPMSDKEVGVNGDCLTGSGAYFNFTINKSYSSPLGAKNDIINRATQAGLKAPTPDLEPNYIFAKDGNTSGGNTPIRQIELTYYIANGDSYMFTFELAEPIPCEVVSSNEVKCAGEPQDTLIQKLIKTMPINTVKVSGNISKD